MTAGIRKLQRKQLEEWEIPTVAKLASMTVPVTRKPEYGSKEGYAHIREQARVQVEGRYRREPVWDLCPLANDRGFLRLPEPSAGDVFFDLETSRFTGEHGLEYLFGFGVLDDNGAFRYEKRWALNAAEERAAFEWFVDFVMARRALHPGMHVYHYGHKEASTLKRLMGWYGTREEAVDRMLRGGVLVDLLSITKQALWASVETYSLKALEPFHGYTRTTPLNEASTAMRHIEHGLELGRAVELDSKACQTVAAYNEDDCHSTLALRNWLEKLRANQVAKGAEMPRPPARDDAPSENVRTREIRVARVAAALKEGVPVEVEARTEEQQARWLLADLLDWHWREARVGFWEKYRLAELKDDDLMDERDAIGELQWTQEIAPQGRKKNWVSVYTFPPQETSLGEGSVVYSDGERVGTVVWIDFAQWVVHISQGQKTRQARPRSVYSFKLVETEEQAESLLRFAEDVVERGFGGNPTYETATALLLRKAPRLLLRGSGETAEEAAVRLALELRGDVLAIQGPPGAGKTYTAAAMILRALAAGKRVGVTANSHKVIVNLLEDVEKTAAREGQAPVKCLHKVTERSEHLPDWLAETTNNDEALAAFDNGFAILAGTAWLWAREDAAGLVDLLFVDEAGQMSLANAVAIAPAARNVVLLGDPQQLEQPVKGSHPEGAAVSALEHLLRGAKTMDAKRGLFLDKTWRLHPAICAFTSELFYEGLLQPQAGLERQRIEGHAWLGQAGLRFLAVEHDGNQNSSAEEAGRIRGLVDELLAPTVFWVDRAGKRRRLTAKDILVVAPYNAQVAKLGRELPDGMRIGTVDKFQGQQAPVVIYSLATSTAEDAPRGMEFLYSLNRLNVATSRAMALVIVVGSTRLLHAQCQTPRQLRLANALCRYVEMSGTEREGDHGRSWRLIETGIR